MLEKALGLSPDAFVPDLEDSVPLEEKENARKTVGSYLPRLAAVGPVVIPRVNSIPSGLLDSDLASLVGSYVYAVSVGKIETADEVQHISNVLDGLERKTGLEIGSTRLLLWIETALGIVNAYDICIASPRTIGVAFGAEDYTNDMGIERTQDNSEIAFPRSSVTVAARAADVLALDTPYFSLGDPEGLRRDAHNARGIGFRGKFAIHPAQIEIINETFAPSLGEIENAQRIVSAFEEAKRSGMGSTSLDGKVIDVPVAMRAQKVLEQAQAVTRRTSEVE